MYTIKALRSVYEDGTDYIPDGYEGNVSLLNRPRVPAATMNAKGWEVEPGEYCTIYSSTITIGNTSQGYEVSCAFNAVINCTPIMADGSVLSEEEMFSYIETIAAASSTKEALLTTDKNRRRILLSVDAVGSRTTNEAIADAVAWAEDLHELQEEWDEYKDEAGDFTEEILFSTDTQDERPVVDATGSFEISEGGSVQIVLAFTHPLYDSLVPLETYISVEDDTEEIFYGRILNKSDPTFTGQITYTAEGALSFLHDGEVPPEPKDSKGQSTKRTLTAEAFFNWCIEQHNATVGDPRRQFTVGTINIDKKSESKEYQVTSYVDTRSAFDQYLRNLYGGYLRARRVNGTLYIDWLKQFDRLDPQTIEIGVNIQELTSSFSAEGIYTVLRPVGANGLLLDPETIDLFPPEKMATMGRIIKSVTFSNADTKEKLQAAADDYVDRLESVILGETSIKLIDMHYLDGTIPRIRIGDRFDHIHGNEGTEFTVSHMDVDFLHCENDTFSFKNRKDLEGNLNSGLSGGTLSGATSRGARSSGLGLKYYHEYTDQAILQTKEVQIIAENLEVVGYNTTVNAHNYERMSRTMEVEDGIVIDEWPPWEANKEYAVGDKVSVVENHIRRGYVCNEAHTSAATWEEDKDKWTKKDSTKESVNQLWGTEVIQNSHEISSVAGNFIVLTDFYDDWPDWSPSGHHYNIGDKVKYLVGQTYYGYSCIEAHDSTNNWENDKLRYWFEERGRKSVQLINGASLVQDDLNGNMVTVAELAGGYENLNIWRTELTGSALWTQRDNITGVVGEFDVVTNPSTGVKTIVIKSGGGMKIRRNNVEYGLYDEDTLTGGLMVDHINAETWSAWTENTFYARGAAVKNSNTGYICLQDHTSADTFQNDSSKWRSVNQTKIKGELVADVATITELNADRARISDLEAHDLIVTGTLSVSGGDIYTTGNINAGLDMGNYIRGKTLRLIGSASSQGAQEAVLNYNDVDGMIVKANVTGNTLQLWKHGDDITGNPSITFSKATTLTPSWSGSPVTVTATQLNSGSLTTVATFSTEITSGFVQTSNPTKNYATVFHKDGTDSNPSEYTTARTEIKLGTLSATPTIVRILDSAGTSFINNTPTYTIPLTTKSVTSNGTFTPGSGNVGFSSVTVNVADTIGNAKSRFNAASGSYYIEAYDNRSGNAISGSSVTYKLATTGSTSSTKVQIQNTSNAQIASTPELSVGSLYNSGHNAVAGDEIILSATAGSGVGTESTTAPSDSITKANGNFSGYVWLKEIGKTTTTYKNLRTFSMSVPSPTESIQNPAAFNYRITATCAGKSVTYLLKATSSGGYSSFAKE